MAKLVNGLFGRISGKVGKVVFAEYRGQTIARSVPRKSNKEPSIAQLIQREKFKVVAEFLKPLKRMIDPYFGKPSGVKSRYNLAMSYHLLEATTMVDDIIQVHLEKVIITKGILPLMKVMSCNKKKLELTVNWSCCTKSAAREKDWVNIIIYSEKHQAFQLYEQVASRNAKSHTIALPASFTGKDNHVWIFVSNQQETQCSNSRYLGMI